MSNQFEFGNIMKKNIQDIVGHLEVNVQLPDFQPGVVGKSVSGNGVQGESTNGTGVQGNGKVGVKGNGVTQGVVGIASDKQAQTFGVLGNAFSPQGVAVMGYTENGATAVRGMANDTGYGVYGSTIAGPAGVMGESNSGVALKGVSVKSTGVAGQSTEGSGVVGESQSASGVVGRSQSAAGVSGESQAAQGIGVAGTSKSGTGVQGESEIGIGIAGVSKDGRGVVGISDSGFAGFFLGNVKVVGTLEKQAGSFKIDHPLDPENKYLCHSFVESPDMLNVYNGNATLDGNGESMVALPDWFEALNKDFRYQLTAIGAPGPNLYIAEEIQQNRFKIAGGVPGARVSWQVTGVRQDAYANAHRIQVELLKEAGELDRHLPVYNQLPAAAD